MATRVDVPSQTIPVGSYQYDITTPMRANGAKITITRDVQWPAGDVFTYRISERQRNGAVTLLTSATERGGDIRAKDGSANPPLVIQLTWPLDADRDLIRAELTVVQAFQASLTVEFL